MKYLQNRLVHLDVKLLPSTPLQISEKSEKKCVLLDI